MFSAGSSARPRRGVGIPGTSSSGSFWFCLREKVALTLSGGIGRDFPVKLTQAEGQAGRWRWTRSTPQSIGKQLSHPIPPSLPLHPPFSLFAPCLLSSSPPAPGPLLLNQPRSAARSSVPSETQTPGSRSIGGVLSSGRTVNATSWGGAFLHYDYIHSLLEGRKEGRARADRKQAASKAKQSNVAPAPFRLGLLLWLRVCGLALGRGLTGWSRSRSRSRNRNSGCSSSSRRSRRRCSCCRRRRSRSRRQCRAASVPLQPLPTTTTATYAAHAPAAVPADAAAPGTGTGTSAV